MKISAFLFSLLLFLASCSKPEVPEPEIDLFSTGETTGEQVTVYEFSPPFKHENRPYPVHLDWDLDGVDDLLVYLGTYEDDSLITKTGYVSGSNSWMPLVEEEAHSPEILRQHAGVQFSEDMGWLPEWSVGYLATWRHNLNTGVISGGFPWQPGESGYLALRRERLGELSYAWVLMEIASDWSHLLIHKVAVQKVR